jgi:hypothetical protein
MLLVIESSKFGDLKIWKNEKFENSKRKHVKI